MATTIRAAAVAGAFYPADPVQLAGLVDGLLARAGPTVSHPAPPKAFVVPHAGFVYSGPIAATAYGQLKAQADTVRRVVLLGPSHYVGFRGLAIPAARRFVTPLGEVELDASSVERLSRLPQVLVFDQAHQREHSLEVQLPFLQRVLPHFTLVPLAVGKASAEEVAEVLDALWGGDETVILISTDLSHYLPYEVARRVDEATAQLIVDKAGAGLSPEHACGYGGLLGMLEVARRRGLVGELLDLRSSGDTAGGRDEVVGYGAFAFREAARA